MQARGAAAPVMRALGDVVLLSAIVPFGPAERAVSCGISQVGPGRGFCADRTHTIFEGA